MIIGQLSGNTQKKILTNLLLKELNNFSNEQSFGTYSNNKPTTLTVSNILEAINLLEPYKKPKHYFNEIDCSLIGSAKLENKLKKDSLYSMKEHVIDGYLLGIPIIIHNYIPDDVAVLMDTDEHKVIGLMNLETLEIQFFD